MIEYDKLPIHVYLSVTHEWITMFSTPADISPDGNARDQVGTTRASRKTKFCPCSLHMNKI